MAIVERIKLARHRWGRFASTSFHENIDPKIVAKFYVTIVQTVLSFGSETWVMSTKMMQRLNSFHHRCARCIAREHIHRNSDGTWSHPPSSKVLESCGLSPISTCIAKHRTTLLTHCAIDHINLCKECLAKTVSDRRTCWWQIPSDSKNNLQTR